MGQANTTITNASNKSLMRINNYSALDLAAFNNLENKSLKFKRQFNPEIPKILSFADIN